MKACGDPTNAEGAQKMIRYQLNPLLWLCSNRLQGHVWPPGFVSNALSSRTCSPLHPSSPPSPHCDPSACFVSMASILMKAIVSGCDLGRGDECSFSKLGSAQVVNEVEDGSTSSPVGHGHPLGSSCLGFVLCTHGAR
jgi:hypothetical protein